MDLKQYLAVFRKWWWLMVVSTLLATVAGYLGVSRQPRIYQATATVIVGQGIQQANVTSQDLYLSQQLAQTYQNMVSRQPILVGAAEALGLPFVPWAGNVSAQLVPGTAFLEISVLDTDPERARALADEIAHQLILKTPRELADDQAQREFVRGQIDNLQKNIQATEQEIKAEQSKLDAATSARAILQYQTNIDALQEKLASYQANYASMLTTVQGGSNYITRFEQATTPTKPISPHVLETVLTAAAIGLVLALGGAFLIEFLDDTIKTADDVRRVADLPTLGSIGRTNGKFGSPSAIAAREPLSPIAEAYRALRTNVQASTVDRPIRTLVVTSARPQEGKSTTATNLAVVMAQAGRSVILVDADLRRSSLHKIFGLPNREGLTTALFEDKLSPDAWHQATDVEKLRVLPSGPLPLNPSEMLGSQKMRQFIEKLKIQADIAIFDTPPTLSVTDAAVLALEADGVLLVADAGHTRRAALSQAVDQLRQVGAHVLGVVLNGLPSRQGKDYYYYQSTASEQRQQSRLLRGRGKRARRAQPIMPPEPPASSGQDVARLDPEQHPTVWSSEAKP